MRRVLSICFVLAALVLAVYWPVQQYDFLSYDDSEYVTDKPEVKAGLTWSGIRYALTTGVVGNWHPVTTLSHILDCQIFGVNPGPQHLVNVLFHAANALLLFLALRRLTGATWRSAIVAGLFALHPLRVESVAWISERKDVLSGFFFMLAIWAYARYAERTEDSNLKSEARKPKTEGSPKTEIRGPKREAESAAHAPFPSSRFEVRGSRFKVRWYWIALGMFALGLMSKPMLVTLPFILLLLDFWPLRRIAECGMQNAKSRTRCDGAAARQVTHHASRFTLHAPCSTTISRLLIEKLPFFALAALFSAITFLVQNQAGAVVSTRTFSFEDRVANALVSYVGYLGKMFWPTDLAAIYPHPAFRFFPSEHWPDWQILAAASLLLAISTLCLCQLRRRPYLAIGWFWYLGMMVPVIGLIQVGEAAMADRYTYLPLIGPVLSLVWLLAGILTVPSLRPTGAPSPHDEGVGRGGTPSAIALRWHQQYAPLPLRLFLGALAVIVLALCSVLTRHQLQYWRDTVALFEHTVDVTADNPGAQFGLGVGLEKEGQPGRAMVHFRVAVAIQPAYAEAHYNIGHLLRKQGARREATEEYLAAIHYKPNDLKFRLNLAGVLMESGETREAVQRFEEALQIDPDSTEALNNLAWLLAANIDPAIRNGGRAVEYGERACQLTQFKQTVMVGTLAAAYAEAGRFADAVATAEKAGTLAEQNGDQVLLAKNQQLLALYRAGKPYHEPASH